MENLRLSVSDILIDSTNKEIGILLRRYNLYDFFPPIDDLLISDEELKELGEEFNGNTIVWDIFWCGSALWPNERRQSYTEEGLLLLLESGVLELYKNI